MAEINVVPYIDVTLVLLIIFMITTPMLQTGVDVDLPQAEAKTLGLEGEDQKIPVVISIDKEGHYYLNSDGQHDEPVQMSDIGTRLIAILADKPNNPVLINADKAIDYGTVVTLMATLKHAGVPNVGLMTETPDQ
jgi:biopolymer transport protein TolR